MNKSKKAILGIIVFLFLLLPLISVYLFNWQYLKLDPPEFIKEYLKFLGGLLSVFVAFYLVNIYWRREKSLKIVSQIRRLCIIHLDTLHRICDNAKESHDLIYQGTWTEKDKHKIVEIDNNVIKHIEHLNDNFNGLLRIINENGEAISQDQFLEETLLDLIYQIEPSIKTIAAYKSTVHKKVKINALLEDLSKVVYKTRVNLIVEVT